MSIPERRIRQAFGSVVLAAMFLCGGSANDSFAVDRNTDEQPLPVKRSVLEGLRLQPGDEPLRTFQPKNPPDPQAKMLGEALARYMTGRIQQERGNFSAALDSYLAAIEQDPAAIEPYQAALPILLQRQETDRARKMTLAAAEKSPRGYELVLAMAAIFARQDQLKDGIGLIQETLQLPNQEENSLANLMLHRDQGLYLRLLGDYSQAAEQYRIVFDAVTSGNLDDETRQKLLVDPGEMFDEFGDVFLKAEDPELALKAFDEASKYREARPGLNSYNLATVFRQKGNSEKALKELEEYFDAQLQTRGRAAYELLKELLVDLRREDELFPRLRKLREQDEHNDSLRYFLADELLAEGKVQEAKELYLNGRDEVTDPRALVGMFSIYRQEKNPEKLLEVMTRAFSSVPRPDDSPGMKQLAPEIQDLANRFEAEIQALEEDEDVFSALTAYARSLEEQEEPQINFLQAYLLGKLASEGDYTDDALHFYKLAISMRNDPPSMLFTELAAHLLDAGRYDEAIEVLTDAAQHSSVALQRDKWRFLYLLSFAYESRGDTDDALAAIREAQKLQPNVPLLHYQEAWVVYHARRWDDALALFEQFQKNYPSNQDLALKCRFHISNIYVEKGDMERGEQILEDVLKEHPDNAQANNDLGYLWADQGKNLERAESMIRKALEQEPDNPAYLDSLGWVLYKQGKYPEAVEQMEKATADESIQDATLMEHLGDCLDKVGRHEEAVAAWKKGLESEQKKQFPNEKLLKSLKSRLGLEDAAPADDAGEQPPPSKDAASPAQ